MTSEKALNGNFAAFDLTEHECALLVYVGECGKRNKLRCTWRGFSIDAVDNLVRRCYVRAESRGRMLMITQVGEAVLKSYRCTETNTGVAEQPVRKRPILSDSLPPDIIAAWAAMPCAVLPSKVLGRSTGPFADV